MMDLMNIVLMVRNLIKKLVVFKYFLHERNEKMIKTILTFNKDIRNKVKYKGGTQLVIGIPKGLFYHEHSILWESFFKNLGCKVIVSENTNKEILNYGIKHCSNETCLPVKVFHGHVYSLKDQVDYIFIPRYISIDKNEYTCPKFCGLPDMSLLNLKRGIKGFGGFQKYIRFIL